MAYPKPPRTSGQELEHKILVGARQGSLRLQSIGLKKVPDLVWNLQSSEKITVKEMYLENNLLAELPAGIGDFVKLYELKLDNNQLAVLPTTISRLTSLQLLFLRKNKIKELPGEIGNCKALTVLWLTNNPLAALPVEFGQLTNLTDLNIDDTPNLNNPPAEVRYRGLKAMQRFLHPFYEARETQRMAVIEAGLREMPNIGMLQGLTSLQMLSNKLPFLGPGAGCAPRFFRSVARNHSITDTLVRPVSCLNAASQALQFHCPFCSTRLSKFPKVTYRSALLECKRVCPFY